MLRHPVRDWLSFTMLLCAVTLPSPLLPINRPADLRAGLLTGTADPLAPTVKYSPDTGVARLQWDSLARAFPAEMASHGHAINSPPTATVVIDGVKRVPVPAGQSVLSLTLEPGVQHDLVVELAVGGILQHRTAPVLLEVNSAQTIRPESFAGIPEFAARLPEREAEAYGLDQSLARLAVEISREKVAWALSDDAEPWLKELSPRDIDVTVKFGERGEPKSVLVLDKKHQQSRELSPKNFHIKVDAAFNGDAFFWDDMFVSLETSWHFPGLAESTLDFWYEVQRDNGGVIPREVRKQNRLSFNPPELVTFGDTAPNGAYTNPNLSGWAEWQLYSLEGPALSAARLPIAVGSIDRYLDWLSEHRATLDEGGNPVPAAFWHDNLGSGMDNLPRGGKPGALSRAGWVDLLAQVIGMRRNEARMLSALGRWSDADSRAALADRLAHRLESDYWSERDGFFFDRVPSATGGLTLDTATPTVAGFWPLWAEGVPKDRVSSVIDRELVPGRFGGEFPVPALSAEHALYSDDGHYWRGGRWANTNAMVAQAFENSGRPDVALGITRKFLRGMSQVSSDWAKSHPRGSIFEFYGFDPNTHRAKIGIEPGHVTRSDFAGWAAVPPVHDLLRHWMGLRPVPAFAGGAAERDRWLDELTHSPLFEQTSYLAMNPFLNRADQQERAAEGYLEWNLLFDPHGSRTEPGAENGGEPGRNTLTVENFFFHGAKITRLSLRQTGPTQIEVAADSATAVLVQVNRLFYGGKTCQSPLAASPIQRVGGVPGHLVPQKFELASIVPKGSESRVCR